MNHETGTTISQTTRVRVLEAAQQLDYRPNAAGRSLRRQRTGVAALVLRRPPSRDNGDPFLPTVLDGLNSMLGAAGYRLLVESVDEERPEAYVSLVREGQVDGIIFARPTPADEPLLVLEAKRIPIVLWGELPGSQLPFVDLDNLNGARKAVEHLVDLGHRRIACITNAPLRYPGSESDARLRGYRDVLTARGLPLEDALVRCGDYTERSGRDAMLSLMAEPGPPTAVFVASDEVALGALDAVKVSGLRVPEDIALVGFDDIPHARHVSPPLTTVRVPAAALGRTAARMLLDLFDTTRPIGGASLGGASLDTELIVRRSSGGPLGRPAADGGAAGR